MLVQQHLKTECCQDEQVIKTFMESDPATTNQSAQQNEPQEDWHQNQGLNENDPNGGNVGEEGEDQDEEEEARTSKRQTFQQEQQQDQPQQNQQQQDVGAASLNSAQQSRNEAAQSLRGGQSLQNLYGVGFNEEGGNGREREAEGVVEDRMSASMNPDQANRQNEVVQDSPPQAEPQFLPPFPPIAGAPYPFIFQQMFNRPNDVVLGVPVPPWMYPRPQGDEASSYREEQQQPRENEEESQEDDPPEPPDMHF
eukprot:TRINITY_DN3717_c0_g1_i1.p1 TRINITY_DN3717_c0_g1~~TRINITY_DN3717_c0_g1_i1.p1  ORF type:complete len:253 (+),score=56.58 TRINITY_DN3717_c0_g1_i1:93-851(+)